VAAGVTKTPGPQAETKVNYTHYDYLELAPGASPQRIEAAYGALLERFQYGHTDAGQDLSGLVRMIHAAYAVLSDPQQRRAYDALLTKQAQAADAELQSQLDAAALTGFTRVQQVPETLRAAIPELAA
jgi:DnaJ-class molecular chaperone